MLRPDRSPNQSAAADVCVVWNQSPSSWRSQSCRDLVQREPVVEERREEAVVVDATDIEEKHRKTLCTMCHLSGMKTSSPLILR